MKIVFRTGALALALAACSMLAGAQASNPVAAALHNSLRRSSRLMVAAAQKMPADKFSFKPTAGSMTFGQLTLHIGRSNASSCQWISGAPPMARTTLTPTSPKDELVAYLQKSFDYCTKVLANLTDANLGSEVPSYGNRKETQAAAIFSIADDWADHYSQQAAYLRHNGILPPSARGGKP